MPEVRTIEIVLDIEKSNSLLGLLQQMRALNTPVLSLFLDSAKHKPIYPFPCPIGCKFMLYIPLQLLEEDFPAFKKSLQRILHPLDPWSQ